MKVLLTGGTGFIGTHLRKRLTRQHEVFALVRHRSDLCDERNLTWIDGDLTDSGFDLDLPPGLEAIVWLAQSKAYRDFPEHAEEIFAVNVRSVMKLLERARQNGIKLFVLASSANVYRPGPDPISEKGSLEPGTFYARSKRIAEMLVEAYASYFKCFTLRLFTVYGPGQSGMLIPSLIDRVREDQPIQLPGGCGINLTPIYVEDVCTIIEAILEAGQFSPGLEVLNVGGDESLNIKQIGSIIGEVLGKAPKLEVLSSEPQGGWVADNTKLKQQFSSVSLVPFREGIRQILEARNSQ